MREEAPRCVCARACEEGGVRKTLRVDKQQHIDPQSLTDQQRETNNGDVEKTKLKPDSNPAVRMTRKCGTV